MHHRGCYASAPLAWQQSSGDGSLVAVLLTWASGLDYARSAPRLFRARATV